ncbi:plant basic secretory protein [Diplodia corticola]|uniref:Plant basic secretory protein n=1 Tax=Diplodia corticola TaxID=236234 RepID=A0A1J9QL17_9PEZI|nr:plant basic secretory protein [Diplodia corticola]OJD29160.1 plant basic secretory protein [Diplodia corticola]
MPLPPVYFQTMTPVPRPEAKKPVPKRKPLLRLELRDLSHEGAKSFLAHLDASQVLEEAVSGVLQVLYSPHSDIPPVRSITLILRSMGGVAYTTGKDIDSDHKEIHFSLDYISHIAKERRKEEMLGVLRHEMVHCWQWNALGTAPGGLIEGIADYVRLKCGFVPPHWKREADGDWDAGYQHTGYFLDHLEKTYGHGSVMAINESLRRKEYDEEIFWQDIFGKSVKHLWKEYGHSLKCDDDCKDEKRTDAEIPHEDSPAGVV